MFIRHSYTKPKFLLVLKARSFIERRMSFRTSHYKINFYLLQFFGRPVFDV